MRFTWVCGVRTRASDGGSSVLRTGTMLKLKRSVPLADVAGPYFLGVLYAVPVWMDGRHWTSAPAFCGGRGVGQRVWSASSCSPLLARAAALKVRTYEYSYGAQARNPGQPKPSPSTSASTSTYASGLSRHLLIRYPFTNLYPYMYSIKSYLRVLVQIGWIHVSRVIISGRVLQSLQS